MRIEESRVTGVACAECHSHQARYVLRSRAVGATRVCERCVTDLVESLDAIGNPTVADHESTIERARKAGGAK